MPEELSKHAAVTRANPAGNSRVASQTELWSVVLRVLSFDEPASKSQYLRKALRKQLDKRNNFDSLTLREQGQIFTSVFGGEEDATVSALVSFILAFEDLKRFSNIAFATWCKQEWHSEPIVPAVADLAFDLTTEEQLWLSASLLSVPSWSKITKTEQGQDHPRVHAIALLLERLREQHAEAFRSQYSPDAITAELLTMALAAWQQVLSEKRSVLPGSFLPEIILLVEGQTEALILPTFAKLLGLDFNRLSAHIESCGGAKQVVKQYLNLKELTVLPIICVLDADVSESAEIIQDSLRTNDKMLTMQAGEIEDGFSLNTFHRLLNIYLKETGCLEPIALSELQTPIRSVPSSPSAQTPLPGERIDVLDRLFRIRGLGNFDKIGFAETAVRNLHKSDVPDDGKRIIRTIEEVHNAGIKLRLQ